MSDNVDAQYDNFDFQHCRLHHDKLLGPEQCASFGHYCDKFLIDDRSQRFRYKRHIFRHHTTRLYSAYSNSCRCCIALCFYYYSFLSFVVFDLSISLHGTQAIYTVEIKYFSCNLSLTSSKSY